MSDKIENKIHQEILAEWERNDIKYRVKRLWHNVSDDMPDLKALLDWRCGYCIFQEQPTWISDSNIDEIEVYGGVTWWEQLDDGSYMFGFDTQHGDMNPPVYLKDIEWLKAECERMAASIMALNG